MSLIIPFGVFTRYVLGTGSQWPEPIAILLMMVFTFIGAAAAYRAGGHIAVGMLTDVLPAAAADAAWAGLVHVLMLGVCGFVVLVWRTAVPRHHGPEHRRTAHGCRWGRDLPADPAGRAGHHLLSSCWSTCWPGRRSTGRWWPSKN